MKNAITIILCLAACISAAARGAEPVTIPASDSRITYIGRTAAENGGSVSFDWAGTTACISFSGTSLSLNCSDTRRNWYNVWIDKEPVAEYDAVFSVGSDTTIVVAGGLKKGTHSVTIQKRTEGEQGKATFRSFNTDGAFLQARPLKERHIEFVGDSYTCGYGTEGADRDQPFRAEEENCNLTYARIIGRFFNADVNHVSHSGFGIVRNYDGALPGESMAKRYSQLFDMSPEPQWTPDMAAYTPDIVVIYLGTNDFSTGKQPTLAAWCENYTTLIGKIRGYYGPEVPILCVSSPSDDVMGDYVRAAAAKCGQPNVHWTSLQSAVYNMESDLGSSWHPNYEGQRKVASCLIPYIATLTGWQMPVKAVE